MDILSGRTVLDSEKEIELPLLPLPGVVLMPGETLPLHIFMPQVTSVIFHSWKDCLKVMFVYQFVSMMKKCLDGNKTFGVCTIKSHSDVDEFTDVGTTAEIFSMKEDTSGGIHTMTVKATGRQRFRIVSRRRQSDRVIVATVNVLEDDPLPVRPAVAFACPLQLMLAPCGGDLESDGSDGEGLGESCCARVSRYKVNMLQQVRRLLCMSRDGVETRR